MPWFRRRPRTTVVTAAALFAGIFFVRVSIGTPADAINMLYALPIALIALAFGLWAGLAAGVVAAGLVAAWVLVGGVDLTVLGWASRLAPMLLLGLLLGGASDRLRQAELERRTFEAAGLRYREAIEINDTLVQGMAAAKWSIEAGRTDSALASLTETIELAHKLVSKLLREADMGLDGHRPPDPLIGQAQLAPDGRVSS
jgi:acetyl-CoA acetyltransferase